jgi:hypothetical protein
MPATGIEDINEWDADPGYNTADAEPAALGSASFHCQKSILGKDGAGHFNPDATAESILRSKFAAHRHIVPKGTYSGEDLFKLDWKDFFTAIFNMYRTGAAAAQVGGSSNTVLSDIVKFITQRAEFALTADIEDNFLCAVLQILERSGISGPEAVGKVLEKSAASIIKACEDRLRKHTGQYKPWFSHLLTELQAAQEELDHDPTFEDFMVMFRTICEAARQDVYKVVDKGVTSDIFDSLAGKSSKELKIPDKGSKRRLRQLFDE